MSHDQRKNQRDEHSAHVKRTQYGDAPRWLTEKWSMEVPHNEEGISWRISKIRGKRLRLILMSMFFTYPLILGSFFVLVFVLPFEIFLGGGDKIDKSIVFFAALTLFFSLRLLHMTNELQRNIEYQASLLLRIHDAREFEKEVQGLGIYYHQQWRKIARKFAQR